MTATLPRRRWYQFSLPTMFVLVFMVSIPLAWVRYSLNWIEQRRQFVLSGRTEGYGDPRDLFPGKAGPAGLWLFGEQGWHGIFVKSKDYDRAKSLFPEATISVTDTEFQTPK
jgi:hypothetical protein